MRGKWVRAAEFRPLTGRMEQQIAAFASHSSISDRVSGILAVALEHIGNQAVTRDMAAGLSVADRQFLMLALALQMGSDQQWRHLTCAACGARFDIGFRLSEIPLTPGGENYPWAEEHISGRCLRLRAPTGEDEACVTDLGPDAALREIALRCVVAIDGEPPTSAALDQFSDSDIDRIDAALEEVAPQLGSTLSTACSECGAPHAFDIDPYAVVDTDAADLYREVHALALRYHWSEAQCLRLPRSRRRMYLDLINQSFGAEH